MFVYCFYIDSLLFNARYYILLLCIPASSWVLPILTTVAFLFSITVYLSTDWMVILRLRALWSPYEPKAKRFYFFTEALRMTVYLSSYTLYLIRTTGLADVSARILFILMVAYISDFVCQLLFYAYTT